VVAKLRIALAALTLAAAACSGDAEPSDEGPSQTTSSSSSSAPQTGSSSPSIVISSGSETVAIGGDLPEDFPSQFPLPDDVTVAYSASSGEGHLVWFGTDASFDELKSFFDDELPANGWTVDAAFDFDDANGQYRAYTISGNGYAGGVYIGEGAPGSEAFEGEFAFFVILSPA
jgi:hypothetical protein